MNINKSKIAIVGLGYVGLPLAVEFGKQQQVLGFDIHKERIQELITQKDRTLETTKEELLAATKLKFTDDFNDLVECNIYIVTVPTPIDEYKRPNLNPLIKASEMIGKTLKQNDVVIYESTVYPGATEEDCVPVLENVSGLKYNEGFYVGYSPERINPGDKKNRLATIVKVTSGSTPETATFVDELYQTIITAGTHKASSIKVAEASKVIENTQRDLNISLVNELSLIFSRMDIDTEQVLEAAGTKWNFLPFRPGLVGGHCIGVDPYYLTHKAQALGYYPEVILSGRRVNDGMGKHVADTVIKLLTKKSIHVVGSNILVLGLAFKENCPDLRNTRIVDMVHAFEEYNASIDIYDPWVDKEEAFAEYGLNLINTLENKFYDAVVLAVAHNEFKEMGVQGVKTLGKENFVLFDIKSLFPKEEVDARL